jgi:hypothetical protein
MNAVKKKRTTCRKTLKSQTSEKKNRPCTDRVLVASRLKEGAV